MKKVKKTEISTLDTTVMNFLLDTAFACVEEFVETASETAYFAARNIYLYLSECFKNQEPTSLLNRYSTLVGTLDPYRLQVIIGTEAFARTDSFRNYDSNRHEHPLVAGGIIQYVKNKEGSNPYSQIYDKAREYGTNGYFQSIMRALDYVREVYPRNFSGVFVKIPELDIRDMLSKN